MFRFHKPWPVLLLASIALCACKPQNKTADVAAPAAEPASLAGTLTIIEWPLPSLSSPSSQTEAAPAVAPPATVGTGATAVMHYTGWLFDAAAAENKGRKFDSSHDRNEPLKFKLGAGEVIRGWERGVIGMQVGGKRRLVIPATLGYGEKGAGDGVIPPGATLVFDVELVAIE